MGRCGAPISSTCPVGASSATPRWRHARRSYDAGSGIRSVADLYQVLSFFEARPASFTASAFAIRSTGNPADRPTLSPPPINGSDRRWGDAEFQLSKTYGDAGGGTVAGNRQARKRHGARFGWRAAGGRADLDLRCGEGVS